MIFKFKFSFKRFDCFNQILFIDFNLAVEDRVLNIHNFGEVQFIDKDIKS